MSSRAHSGILPPVQLSSRDHTIYSIDARLPREMEEEISTHAVANGIPWAQEAEYMLTDYRESLMTRDDHARERIEEMIRTLPLRPPRKMSARKWDSLRSRVYEEISQLKSVGSIGSLIVSFELYHFIRSEIESGAAGSVRDVFTKALPFLRSEGPKPGRCTDASFFPLDFQ